jgi:molybdate transport system substrate-binding protein
MPRLLIIVSFSLLGLLTGFQTTTAKPPPVTLLVSAASSLTFALQEIGTQFEQATGIKVIVNFGSTGQLAQQIERGAPVDLFMAANVTFIDRLERQGLIIPDTKVPYARGRLTLWTRVDSPLHLARLDDLRRPEVQRIAIANPSHAPYGMAAREALQAVGLWKQLQPKLVMGENIRQTLQYAATGNVDAALVALSLSVQRPGRWVAVPEALHRPIIQALAVIKRTEHESQARQFAVFIRGPQGQPIMHRYGFTLPAKDAGE